MAAPYSIHGLEGSLEAISYDTLFTSLVPYYVYSVTSLPGMWAWLCNIEGLTASGGDPRLAHEKLKGMCSTPLLPPRTEAH